MGLALDLYLTLEVEMSERWEISSTNAELQNLATDEQHFICQVAIQTAAKFGKKLTPCKIQINSNIPLARGLGSSASAIIAAIELADIVGSLSLTKQEKLLLATELEGHPDNVGASLFGGLVIGCYQQKEVDLLSFRDLAFEVVTVIPNETLLTKESREVLPAVVSYQEAIQASSTANLLVAALLSQNWDLAGKMMKLDSFHQPYRKPLIPLFSEIEHVAKLNGAFGAALSGAGPTVICFMEKGNSGQLVKSLEESFPTLCVKKLNIDYQGSYVNKTEQCAK
jgi:homoserine kinase